MWDCVGIFLKLTQYIVFSLLTKYKTPYIIDPQKKKATPTSHLFRAVIPTAKPQYAICMFVYYHILLLNVNDLCAVEKGKFCQWQKQKVVVVVFNKRKL